MVAALISTQSNFDIFQEFPKSFFEGMKELKVVALLEMSIRSLPASLRCLTNLRTLSLFFCRLTEIDLSIIGALENLEILSFVGLEIHELTEEMGNLTHLKILDLLNSNVGRVPPGILSRLSKLEELYLGKIFQKWYHAEDRIDEGNALITELESLPNLVSLTVWLPRIEYWPRDLVLEKVKKFDIALMRDPMRYSQVCNYLLPNKLELSELNVSGLMLAAGLKMLWKSAKVLDLRSIAGLTTIVNDFFDLEEVCFGNLIKLSINSCKDLKCLVNTTDHGQLSRMIFTALEDLELRTLPKLFHLWKGPTQLVWLCNLRSVIVYSCNNLKSVFSIYIARSLVQLEQLDIQLSHKMEVIVSSEGAGEHEIEATTAASKIEFPKLTQLRLRSLQSLATICRAVDIAIVLPRLNVLVLEEIPKLNCLCLASGSEYNTNTTVQPLFHNEDTLTSIERLEVSEMDNLIEIWHRDLKANLREMRVENCPNLPSILSPSNLKCMQNLEELIVGECESVKVAFDVGALNNADEDHGAAIALPSLDNLTLYGLPNLTHVWANYSPVIQGFQNLRSLMVQGCGSLKILFSPFIAKLLVKLEQLDIGNCCVMKAIIAWEQEVDDEGMRNTIIFPRLTEVKLQNLQNLMSFCPQAYTIEGTFLKHLVLHRIPKLSGLCPTSESNFDTTIHSLFNNKDSLTSIETLVVSYKKNLIEIWHRDLKAKLREMRVNNCPKLSSILSPSNLKCMQNLEELIVEECESVKVAFDVGALNADEDHGAAIALPSLDNLTLYWLPNLMHVWANYSPGIQGFQNLRSLAVQGCDSLRILFSPFIAKLLVKLEQLDVRNCDLMEAIIAWEQGVDDEGMRNTTILPRLTEVKLEDLPNLMSFCPQAYTIEGTFLKTVEVVNCPETKVLPSAFQLMQRL